ncbi:hypothetical protein RAS12_16175 [Achromobacter seleniivolatilans]|uniref:Uncharacterized protein n=1 Tax=Achromobacter seleniivolatilans TaxID=3047478 RepID=A0ABY9LUR8_9BURK|nr:hypothetical protein [Achromobacter sp. R39]WMD18190.1 hypothetical protein RAS12_16175 [Achromobacter sp. R39]
MLRDRGFQIGLALFALAAVPLIVLLLPKTASHPSIGGGGYDLSNFVYTLALLAFTGLWSLVTLLGGMTRSSAVAAKRMYGLAAIGAATFVAAIIAFGHHLH